MKILALETTEKFGSISLLENHLVLGEIILPKDRRSSQTLHPAIDTLFQKTQIAPKEVAVVAVVVGPGSFTGLRVGVTAAKVFAYAAGAKIIALDTFQTIALQTMSLQAIASQVNTSGVSSPADVISIGVDAQRGDVVAAVFRPSENGFIETIREPLLMPVSDWWKHADEYENVLFTGPALERWGQKMPTTLLRAEESGWFPNASYAGKLAYCRIAEEQFDNIWSLLPIYSRPSAAEEKRG